MLGSGGAMTNVYFCKTDYAIQGGYGSHSDFWRLVELSGYPIIPVSQIDPRSDNTYIFTPTNGETQNGWYNPRARIVLYQLEWNTDQSHTPPPGVEVWCGDKHHSEQYGYKYVPLGSHPGLNLATHRPKVSTYARYDMAAMMYRDPPRRARLLNQMSAMGLSIAPDGWGQTRSADLMDSRAMVLIHQFDNLPVLPPLRMCIAAAHKLAVITEHVADAGIFTGFIDDLPYESMAQMVYLITHNPNNRLKEQGETLYRMLCEDYTFRHSIETALQS
jgi:hypothetical protein